MKKHLTLLVFLAGPLLECLKVGRLPAPPIVATQGPWSESIFWNKVCPKIFSETKSGRKILKFTFPLRWSFPPWTITVRLASDHLAANGGACNKRIEHICFAHFAIWESSGDVALTDICFEQLAIWERYDGTRGNDIWFRFEIFWMGWIRTVAPLWLET